MPNHLTHRRNDHGMFRFNHFVHHAVRESLRVTSSDIPRLVPTTMEVRIFCQSIPNANNFLNKIRPHRLLCIIPSGCLDHAWLHFRAELDPPLHLEKREQSRVFISFSGTAEPRGLLILLKSLLHQ